MYFGAEKCTFDLKVFALKVQFESHFQSCFLWGALRKLINLFAIGCTFVLISHFRFSFFAAEGGGKLSAWQRKTKEQVICVQSCCNGVKTQACLTFLMAVFYFVTYNIPCGYCAAAHMNPGCENQKVR